MKGKVFIAWSALNENHTGNELAIAVKSNLERSDYIGIVGGMSRGESGLHVGQAVLKEIDQCNQALFLMQKKENGTLSNNVMFELGYSLSKFNANKIHVFYVDIEPDDKTIPSDIKGIWATYLKSTHESDLASAIVEEFLSNQKNIIPENKMDVIDSYYSIKEAIQKYPDIPSCSEYELAQYILLFSQAAYMFRNEKDAENTIENLIKQLHNPEKSLDFAIRYSLCYLRIFLKIQNTDNCLYLNKEDFRSIRKHLNSIKKEVESWPDDDFSEWFLMLINDILNYAYILFASSPKISKEESLKNFNSSIEYAYDCLKMCDILEKNDHKKENYICVQLYKAYIYRNLYTAYTNILDKNHDAFTQLELSLSARRCIVEHYEVHPINSKLFDNFELEYYLALSEYLDYFDDEDDRLDAKEDCEAYIQKVKKLNHEKNFFVDKIEQFLSSIE